MPAPWHTLKIDPDHRLRPSQHTGKLEYYRTEKDRQFDKLRLISPEQYLQEFHPGVNIEPFLDPLRPTEVMITTTAEEAIRVYMTESTGPGSCMRGSVYPDRAMTASAYGEGDIRIAYNKDMTARCLVWPEKKIFGRFYGAGAAKLKNALNLLGYTDAYKSDQTKWIGARLWPLHEGRLPFHWDYNSKLIIVDNIAQVIPQ